METMLYPRVTKTRRILDMNGMWKIFFDFKGEGEASGFCRGIPGNDQVPVPSSFADLYTEKRIREFCGDIWYETELVIPSEWNGKKLEVRFAGAAHRTVVFINGEEAARHEGGFTPFMADVTNKVLFDIPNRIVVKVNNELSDVSLPCGDTLVLKNGDKMAVPFFDFYNYSGIQRPVQLVVTPQTRIVDFSVSHSLNLPDAFVSYVVCADKMDNNQQLVLTVYDEESNPVAKSEGISGVLKIKDVKLWNVRAAYLYKFVMQIVEDGAVIDEYYDMIGIRTVEISGTDIRINGNSVYLKGFGKHEDSPVIGRGLSLGYMKRDYELMKWIGANSFRTSHYPYAEEMYQMADREGFLIIDEVAAVGFIHRSGGKMFTDAGTGVKPKSSFASDTTAKLMENHIEALREMIQRDKNHASVIAWSLFNEPESISEEASAYFKVIFDKAREFDMQKRPRTFAMELSSGPDAKLCHQYCDFWAMNRYYGWYEKGGYEISDAMEDFKKELDEWAKQVPLKPMVFTEYGADTSVYEHTLPAVMWSQEYQVEYLQKYHEIFDSYSFIKGEQVWNFADFQTGEEVRRVNGNKKGVFTRDRQPKDSAFVLKARWGEGKNAK